ncbi:carbohydrate ABC transporter permease [Jiangella gansuensis]|uniref:carbohydrate ABC transporter permease n=1 Tax=Jiangella gansuensis TaxID=281473 RepID=UPI00047AA8B7|nr:sugar ABC transporter permease [Jiangella gansuensis]
MATATSAPADRPAPVGGPPARRRRTLMRRRQARTAWLLAIPFLLLFAAFTAGPVLASLFMSFTDMRSTDLRTPLNVELAGLDNYTQLFGDPLFRKVAVNTAIFVLVGVPLTMGLALAAAVGLNSITRLRAFFRLGYYLPVVTSIVAVAVVWRFLLQPDSGPINQVLSVVGIDGPNWLGSTSLALPSLIAMAAWRNLGTLMVIFLAGLQTVPKEMLEAAEVDGAGRWQRFRYVTLPLLRPTLLFGAVITGIGYLQFFEEPYVMTRGGPLNATRSVSFYIYDHFGFGNYGYAAAASYVLFVAIVVLTAVQFRLLRPKT